MLIKLIQPRMTMRPMDTIIKPRMAPSLGLLTLATLTPPEHEILIEDENVRRLTLDDQPDLVGVTANVDNALRAYQIADGYRARGIPVVGRRHPHQLGPAGGAAALRRHLRGQRRDGLARHLRRRGRRLAQARLPGRRLRSGARTSPSPGANWSLRATTSTPTPSAPAAAVPSSASSATTAARTSTTRSSTGRWTRSSARSRPSTPGT